MRPLFINSSPNSQKDDFVIALKEFLQPWKWRKVDNSYKLEEKVQTLFNGEIGAVSFDSARSSFYQILKAWKVGPGDEVIVPAFTCVVIVNPILWVGAKPVYVDIDPLTLNMDLKDLRTKITENTKVILAQHTFGLPLEMDEAMEIASKKGIKVVEDCAHSLGLMYKSKYLGTIGDASVITFGITKVISGVRGGMALTKDKFLYKKLRNEQIVLPPFPFFHAFRFLFNPIIWHLIMPVYYLGLGKFTLGRIIIQILHGLKILGISNIVEPVEEMGKKPNWIPTNMSGSLAKLASHQIDKLDEYNAHRKKIARIYAAKLNLPYFEESLYLRFPLMVKDKKGAMEFFRKKRVMLGDWYKAILHIPKKNYRFLKYFNTCPNAEMVTEHLINLPTYIKVNETQAKYIAEKVRQFVDYEFYRKFKSQK